MGIVEHCRRLLRELYGEAPRARRWDDRAQRLREVDERARWFVSR